MSSLFYYAYQGGKRSEIKYINEILNQPEWKKDTIKTIIEPFCGSCALSLNLYIKEKLTDIDYVVNDIDKMHINLLNDIKKDDSKKYFDYVNEFIKDDGSLTINKEDFLKGYKKKNKTLNEYFFYNKIYNLKPGIYPEHEKRTTAKKDYKKYLETDKFFKHAKITNEDALECMNKYKDDENALIFIDPPYFNSSNTYYLEYMNEKKNKNLSGEGNQLINTKIDYTQMYIDIYQFMKTCKCKVILIMNTNALLDFIFSDFKLSEYNKTYANKHHIKENGKLKHYNNETKHVLYGKVRSAAHHAPCGELLS